MFNKLLTYLLKKKVLFDLRKRYRYMNEVEKVMEMYTTRQIMNSADAKAKNSNRQLLLKHQETISVQEDFIDFLKTL